MEVEPFCGFGEGFLFLAWAFCGVGVGLFVFAWAFVGLCEGFLFLSWAFCGFEWGFCVIVDASVSPQFPFPPYWGTGAELSGVQWTARNDSPVSKGDERAKETRVSTRSSSPIAN